MASPNLLNLEEIRQLVDEMGGDAGEILPDLVESLEHDAVRSLGEMRAAVENADGKTLKQAAHRLKGSSATLGMAAVASLCQQLEIVGANDDLSGAAFMLDRLERISAESLQALRELSL
jgi:two-component system, sensor histidine kinase and response regulator